MRDVRVTGLLLLALLLALPSPAQAHISGRRTSVGLFGGICTDCSSDWSRFCHTHLRFEPPDDTANSEGFTDASGTGNHASELLTSGLVTTAQKYEGVSSLRFPSSGNRTFAWGWGSDFGGRVKGQRLPLLFESLADFTTLWAMRYTALPASNQRIFTNGFSIFDGFYFMITSGGAVEWHQEDSGGYDSVTSVATITTGAWFSFAAVYDAHAGLGRMYLDGTNTQPTFTLDRGPEFWNLAGSHSNSTFVGDGSGTVEWHVDDFAFCNGAWTPASVRKAEACGVAGGECRCSLADPTQYANAPKHADFGGSVTGAMAPCNQVAPAYVNGAAPSFAPNVASDIGGAGGGAWFFDGDQDPIGDGVTGSVRDRSGRGNDLDSVTTLVSTSRQGLHAAGGNTSGARISYCRNQNGNVCAHPEDFTSGLAEYSFGLQVAADAVSADQNLVYTNADVATDGGFRLLILNSNPDKLRIEHKTGSGVVGCTGTTTVNGTWQSVSVRFDGAQFTLWRNGALECGVASGAPLDHTGVFTVRAYNSLDDVWFAKGKDYTEATLRRIEACNVDGEWCRCSLTDSSAYLSRQRHTSWSSGYVAGTMLGCSAAPEVLGATAATTTSTTTSSSSSTSTSSSSTSTTTSSTTSSTA